MKRAFFALACAFGVGSVSAQYKCVALGGGVAFQQTPCAAGTQQQKLVIRSSEVPTQPAPLTLTPVQHEAEQK